MQPLPNASHAQQSALAHYCRTNSLAPETRVAADRAYHYRRLVFNVIEDGLQSAYPLTRQLLTEDEWDDAVLDFHANHACKSAQVWQMPREWMEYLLETQHPLLGKYPQLRDLLLFEWTEIALYMQADIPAAHRETGTTLVINPEYQLLQLSFPVHLLPPTEIEAAHAAQYFVWIHRHPETGKVIFTDISMPIAQWLLLLAEGKHTAQSALEMLCQQWYIQPSAEMQAAIIEFLAHAFDTKLILGFAES